MYIFFVICCKKSFVFPFVSRKDIAKLEVEQQNHLSYSRKLSNITNLSLADEEFVYNVNCDIKHFIKQRHTNGVLLFPPVNNFRRFLIHQTCENFRQKYDLFTFSVGQGPFRRTVICFKNQLLDPHKYAETAAAANFETRNKHNTTQVKSWRSGDNRRIETSNYSNITGATINKRDRKMGVEKNCIETKTNKSNPGDLYRPPALRNYHESEVVNKTNETETNDENSSCATSNMSKQTSSAEVTSTTTTATTTTTSISCNNSPIHRNENGININNITTTSTQQNTLYSMQQQQQQHQHDEHQTQQPQRQQQQQQARRERRPDRAVYIPRARRSQTTPPNTTTTQTQQPPPQHQPLSAQPLAPTTITGNTTTTTTTTTTTNQTGKIISQQLAITYDDTTSASVNQKPSSKADEVSKQQILSNSSVSTSTSTNSTNSNTITTTITTKKKEKLSKENKELREQRREQRLLKKSLSNISSQQLQQQQTENHISKNNLKLSENSLSNDKYDDSSSSLSSIQKTVIVNSAQNKTPPAPLSPSSINVEKYFSELYCNNENENSNEIKNIIFKGFNCDSESEQQQHQLIQELLNSQQQQELLNSEQQSCVISTTNNFDVLKKLTNTDCNLQISNNCIFNDCENPQLLLEPPVNQSFEINSADTATTTDIIINNNNFNNNNNNNCIKMPKKSSNKNLSNKISSEMDINSPNLRIEDAAPPQQPPAKCDIEEQELQRASKEINRSNRRIMKQTFVSDILQIPDHIDEEENDTKSKTANSVNTSGLITNSTIQRTNQFDSNTEEEEEDDWENMFNDSGDCLDPKIMQELTASVGKCKIELPKMDYSAYLTKQSILNEEEFPHVLEVSNFPVEFKNQDLLMVFSQYKESGFDIKWVDDTHALAVFSSSRIAAEVLTMGHPFVVLKPLAEATVESRIKAKKCAASLQPYRPRPQTCAALARRLVTGALGVRLKTAAAERENEKRVLHEAKERKLLAAKQRDEVWES